MEDKSLYWDASASWNGYTYQGKVALLAVLEKICKLKDTQNIDLKCELAKYSLELEWIEDFALVCDNEYLTIHQVKNKDKTNIKDYSEALANLAEKLDKNPNIQSAYLHSKNKIGVKDWGKEIKCNLQAYIPDEIKVLNEILTDSSRLDNTVDSLKKLYKEEKQKFDMRTNDINKQIIDEIMKRKQITEIKDITENLVKDSISNLVTNKKNVLEYLSDNNVIN